MSAPPAAPAPIVGLLLAAGRASRFRAATGRDKLAEPIPDGLPNAGVPVIVAALNALRPAVDQVLAVVDQLNPRAIELVEAQGCPVLRCTSGGTGESIALGVHARPDARGWLVALADMPLIRTATIRMVADALHGTDLAAPTHDGQRGHPVGFGRAHRETLLRLSGDEGARAILAAYTPLLLPTDDAGVLRDIDRPEDWTAAKG